MENHIYFTLPSQWSFLVETFPSIPLHFVQLWNYNAHNKTAKITTTSCRLILDSILPKNEVVYVVDPFIVSVNAEWTFRLYGYAHMVPDKFSSQGTVQYFRSVHWKLANQVEFWFLSVALSSAHAQCKTWTNPKWRFATTHPCNHVLAVENIKTVIVANTAPIKFSTVPAKKFDLDIGVQNFWTAWRLNFRTVRLVPCERNTGQKFGTWRELSFSLLFPVTTLLDNKLTSSLCFRLWTHPGTL